ncbi:MAG: SWIM zinc finger family protein [Caldilineaceae bacterium]|nr:SWIM zinc finger family protein [Caldilineaceae bacterium]
MSIDGWLSPFWKTLEEIGWRLLHKQRTSSVDYTWTLAPMKELSATGFPARTDLLPYVEKIRPLAGDRAQRGLELAISGKVQKVGVGDAGEDLWRVAASRGDAYSVSIKARYCTCPDAANGAPRWFDAPLCKHRIAVMYICRWQEDQQLVQADNVSHIPDTPSRPPEYITVAPPTMSSEGWRWIHVYTNGKLNRSSTDEFPSREQAIQTAQVVAQCKNLPLLLMPPITKSC